MKIPLIVLSLLFSPAVASAGDPCPIEVEIQDLGVPEWLDRDALLDNLTSQSPWIGIRYSYGAFGITLTDVTPLSPAKSAGLEVGDLVMEIDGVAMSDQATINALFDAKEIGEDMVFTRENRSPATVRIGRTDPIPLGLVRALGNVDCRVSKLSHPTEAEKTAILPMLFNENRGFRCDDAHIALQALHERNYQTRVYFVRGSRRILISMPYWGSTCVASTTLDGENLSDAALIAAVEPAIADYIQDRFQNP
ncbi:PDZ domain-containing protein [Yoonia sp. 2307UL14-13]|uniref:PDZ domain-containing protein n=1 Tax=Yoonia sp. 2307UL14-13 TaxID=3126506 RepID=UPI0030A09F93